MGAQDAGVRQLLYAQQVLLWSIVNSVLVHSEFTMSQLISKRLGLASASVGAQDVGVRPLLYAQQVGEEA